MAIYSHKYNGFIADAADIDFKRCDGTIYHCESATATSLSPTANSITINGGTSAYPIGFIDTDKGLEASFTDARFDADLFEIANAVTAVDADGSSRETKLCTVITGGIIELPFEVDTTSVYIRGLTLTTSTPTTGEFSAAYASSKTTITFYASDVSVGDEIWVSYNRRLASAHTIAINTTTPTAIGELWMHWPVYSSGDDCTEAAKKGLLHVHVYRVRASSLPGVDTSYKTAATFPVTFTAIDPHRADGLMYKVSYEAFTSAGAINTTYSGGAFAYD